MIDNTDPAEVLRSCPTLAPLGDARLGALAALATIRDLAPDELLVEAGRSPTTLHVVAAGRFRVIDAAGRAVAEIDGGEMIGEISLADQGSASAEVRALRPARVVEVPISAVREQLRDSPEASLQLAELVAGRLRERNTRRGLRPPRVIAVTGGADAARLRPVLADIFPSAVPAGPDEDVWELERDHLVILDGDEASTKADLEILISGPSVVDRPARAPRRIEVALGWPQRRGLARGVDMRVRVDPGDLASLQRLARIAVGGARVLVLSGGGWRAAPNLGVLAELEAAGVEHDVVIGVSASSPSTVMSGMGRSVEEIIDRTYEFGRLIRIARDFGPTHSAVTTGRTLTAAAKHVCGDARLDDLARPALVAATSLTTGALLPMAQGPAWRAVRASSSLPVIFPPVRVDGDLLVDGGVVENVPTSPAYDLLPEPDVTAVAVSSTTSFDFSAFSETGVERREMDPRRRARLAELMAACLRRSPGPIRCDRLVEVDNADVGMFSRRQFDRGVGLGREAALGQLGPLLSRGWDGPDG